MIKKILLLVLILLICLFQISFISEFSFLKDNFNLVLVIVILLTFFTTYKIALIYSFLSGVFLDIFSIYSFGLITIAFLLTVFIINLLFKRLITNKETYSLILVTLVGTLIFNLFLIIATNLFYVMNWNFIRIIISFDFLYVVVWQLLIHSLLAIVIFIMTKFINKKLLSKFFIS